MKHIYLISLCFVCVIFVNFSFAQSSDVKITVKWPDNSFENKLEVYNTANDLLITLCDDTQCYTNSQLGTTDAYGGAYDLGCATNGTDYYIVMYDIADDGWDSSSYVSVEVAGVEILNDDGSGASVTGSTLYFDVSGGELTCSGILDTDGDGIVDYLDYDDDADGIADALENLGNNEFECTLPDLVFENVIYDVAASSGSAGNVGAVYRFGNAIQGFDILMEITELDNTTIVNIDDDTVDTAANLQTRLEFTGTGTPGVTFDFTIVDAATTTPSTEIFRVNGITWDCDGGSSLAESVIYYDVAAYGTENPTSLLTTDLGAGDIQISASGLQEGPGFSDLLVLRAYYQFIGNAFSLRMQAIKTSSSDTERLFGMSFTQCNFLDFNPHTLTIVNGEDLDNDGYNNHLDIDSDNDGIPDNVEGQSTLGYIAPTQVVHINGMDVAYGAGINTVDTDGDTIPDFLEIDTDNDGISDLHENGMANAAAPADNDSDGLSNNFETTGVNDAIWDANEDIENPSDLSILPDTDGDLLIGGDLDYRDLFNVNPPASATIDFDGVDDYLDSNLNLSGSDQVSIMTWVKLDPAWSNTGNVINQGDLSIQITAARTLHINLNSANILLSGASALNLNEWTHISVLFNRSLPSTQLKVYINGELIETSSESSLSNAINASTDLFTIGKKSTSNVDYFNGDIDEVRVFDIALSEDQLRKIIYQEIQQNGGSVSGIVVPKTIVDDGTSLTIPWANLKAYYPMTNIINAKTSDFSGQGNDATLHYTTTVQEQTAPMPYTTKANGALTDVNTYTHGDVWNINELINSPYTVLKISHDVSLDTRMENFGLFIDADKTLSITDDNEINNSWYFELNGILDLASDSQLIQGIQSDLVTSANGKILRRQEGSSNVFWYNYWSSPVGATMATTLIDNNTTANNPNNSNFQLDMIKDGLANALQFTTAYDEIGKISSAWLYSFVNGVTYYDWNALAPTSTINAGNGYTQKGTGNVGLTQDYIFEGKPNNGTIILAATDTGGAGSVQNNSLTTYLVGNPYASALDARQFISDNAGVIDGTIKLWEQWAGTSHVTAAYEGGYAYINSLTTVRAYQYSGIPIASQVQTDGLKMPSFYIPVGQGFFVEVVNDGVIEFNNGQRTFMKESDANPSNPYLGSSFFKNGSHGEKISNPPVVPGDQAEPQIMRLELVMSNNSSRSIVLGFGENFTDEGREYGYDGGLISNPPADDFGSLLNGDQYVIQALAPMTVDKVVDLVFHASGNHGYTIKLTEITNIPEEQDLYLRDNLLGTYFDLRQEQGYSFTSEAGQFPNRFDVVFHTGNILNTESFEADNNLIYYNGQQHTIIGKGLKEDLKQIILSNALGQSVAQFNNIKRSVFEEGIELSALSSGLYVLSLKTESNTMISKKIIVE